MISTRCLRLHKDCFFRPIKSRNNTKKKATRIGLLEDKVDQILGQLNSTSQPKPQNAPPTPKSCESSPHPCDVIGNGFISEDEAAFLLNSFRDMIPCFPFVQLSKDTTIKDLRSEKPFLLLSILLVSSFQDVPLHMALEEISKNYLGAHVLQGNHPQPLDTVQGILIILAGTKQKSHLMRFSKYLHLAHAIINCCKFDRSTKIRMMRQRLDVMLDEAGPAETSAIQREERRALIGFYLLDATSSLVMQKAGTMPWSPFLESCALKLSQECEYPTDRHLINYVQLQHMLGRIDALVIREEQVPPLEVNGIIRSLLADFEEYKSQLPFPVDSDVLAALQVRAFRVHIYQSAVFDFYPPFHNITDQSLALPRIEALCHGLSAAKDFITFYFSLPLGIEKSYSYLHWVNAGFIIAASCKLAIASLEPSVRHNPQVKELRESLDYPRELSNLTQRMYAVDRECKGSSGDQHETFFYQEWLRHLGEWFAGKYRLAELDSSEINDGGLAISASGVADNGLYGDPPQDTDFPWADLQDVTVEELLNAWLGPMAMPNFNPFM
ncbi:hypothetical protein N7532_006661 [Penicillium argentinense]|uniref:Transcription factor domain-containing protein n=1 Tax=Penicillium argentinense TaxID=1131581 RepID=A0A9W9KB19_9EURO|nr:uncharacterized protein N7532_006661 [Penicillium argentinense]KAJ5099660.1 hypothetical protein N7532_006661 [Penicillium argentinense]